MRVNTHSHSFLISFALNLCIRFEWGVITILLLGLHLWAGLPLYPVWIALGLWAVTALTLTVLLRRREHCAPATADGTIPDWVRPLWEALTPLELPKRRYSQLVWDALRLETVPQAQLAAVLDALEREGFLHRKSGVPFVIRFGNRRFTGTAAHNPAFPDRLTAVLTAYCPDSAVYFDENPKT